MPVLFWPGTSFCNTGLPLDSVTSALRFTVEGGSAAMSHTHADGQPQATSEEQLRRVTVGAVTPLNGPITLADYDLAWPEQFAREAARIRRALGERALLVEHVGSTAVPGLIAKPIVDILLVVADSADEPAYVPALEAAGYVLRIREPDWDEHRLFNGPEIDVNLHC